LFDSDTPNGEVFVGFQDVTASKRTLYASFSSDGLGSPTGKHLFFGHLRR
jgi:hypothetical protein